MFFDLSYGVDIILMIRIMEYLRRRRTSTVSGLARALGISKRTASKYVRMMNMLGLLEVNVVGKAWYVRPGPKADAFTHLFSGLRPVEVIAR